jgi:hypothetical protein
MKRILLAVVLILFVLGLILVVAAIAPLPISAKDDFIILYYRDAALLKGIDLYDYAAQVNFVAQAQGIETGQVILFPYPYPPWYALSTLYLGLLPIQVAARAWFLLNLLMICLATWLLMPPTRRGPRRLFVILAALVFVPAFGLMVVGQYSAPVLLGAALFIFSDKKKSAVGLGIALALMTFKPHLGGFLVLAGLVWLISKRQETYARHALAWTLGIGLFLFVSGFLADPAWPFAYPRSLMSFSTVPGVASRDLTASFPAILVKLALGRANILLTTLLGLLIFSVTGFLAWRQKAFQTPDLLIASVVVMTLLGDPYMFNYDYVLMLVPLLVFARKQLALFEKVVLGVVYFIPWLTLLTGVNGNILIAISAILMLLVILRPRRVMALPGWTS